VQVTWAYIKTTLHPVIQKVIESKFQDPKQPKDVAQAFYNNLAAEVESSFQSLINP